jgi:hypothetical protein
VEALKPAARIAAQSRELNLNRPRVPAGGGAAAGGATGAAAWVGEGEGDGDGDGDGDGVGVGDGDAVDGWRAGDAGGVGLVRARAESGVDWCSRDWIETVATIELRRITARRTMRMGSRAGPAVAQLRNLIAAP